MRGVLTDGAGGLRSLLIATANAHDSTLIGGLIEAVVVDRPPAEEHLCLDKGFDTPAAIGAGYEPHIRPIGEEARPTDPATGHQPRRWVVERTLGWLSPCRGLLVRNEKKAENYLGMTELACAMQWWRRLCRLHGEPVSGKVPSSNASKMDPLYLICRLYQLGFAAARFIRALGYGHGPTLAIGLVRHGDHVFRLDGLCGRKLRLVCPAHCCGSAGGHIPLCRNSLLVVPHNYHPSFVPVAPIA